MVNGLQVTCLFDSGATHNFMSDSLVTREGLPLENFLGFHVMVADGFKRSYNKRVPEMSVEFDGYTITNNFYMIKIVNSDTILGIQWLHFFERYIQDF